MHLRDFGVGVVVFAAHRQRLDGHVAAVARRPDDRHEALQIDGRRLERALHRFFDLPVDRVRGHERDVGVGIGGEVFAGVDERGAPLVIDAAEEAEVFGAGADEVAVILDGDDDAKLLAVRGTFAEGVGHPGLDLVARGVGGGLLPGLEGWLRIGEGADGGGAEAGGDFDPGFEAGDAFGAGGGIGGGEVVAHAGAADVEAEVEGVAFEAEEVAIGGGLRVAFEEVAGEVDGIEAELGGEVADLEEVEALAGVFGVSGEEIGEGVGVEGGAQVGAAVAGDGLRGGAEGGSTRGDEGQQGRGGEETTTAKGRAERGRIHG